MYAVLPSYGNEVGNQLVQGAGSFKQSSWLGQQHRHSPCAVYPIIFMRLATGSIGTEHGGMRAAVESLHSQVCWHEAAQGPTTAGTLGTKCVLDSLQHNDKLHVSSSAQSSVTVFATSPVRTFSLSCNMLHGIRQ